MNVVVGVAGGIAAYKACSLIRAFKEGGDEVTVIPTQAALSFVGKTTFEALSGNKVSTTVFDEVAAVQHVRIGKEADLIVVAPATADLLARVAAGRADDLLAATLLVATCPVVFAPAMHTEMWANPATQANVALLRERGYVVIDPAVGRLTGADSGAGRLPDPEQIFQLSTLVAQVGTIPRILAGKKVVISAGGTVENIDPVRYISNHSSGRQGFALAEVAQLMGAQVSVIAGNTEALPAPIGSELIRVSSAREMHSAIVAAAEDADIVIMAAAVADYRPDAVAENKLKKGSEDAQLSTITLSENPDILKDLVRLRREGTLPSGLTIMGFAAETGDAQHSALDFAREKISKKGCDFLMCNDVAGSAVFGDTRNEGYLLTEDGTVTEVEQGSKFQVAYTILNEVSAAQ